MRYKIYNNKKELLTKWSSPSYTVLDIGYHGQEGGKYFDQDSSPHAVLNKNNQATYGLDIEGEEDAFHYRGSAEDFVIPHTFDVIFGLDVIEHLSNPGLFLESAKKHLKPDGSLVITTPNCFCIFNLAGKLAHYEPAVNKQHTCYYSLTTLKRFVRRHGYTITEISYVRELGCTHTESFIKKVLNAIDYVLSFFTTKYMETIVIVVKKDTV